ncbi:HAMP domain-containing histidine kinase [Pedobacter changchengzhani]|uniref:histidine kinase n=1 Tax=Pedobacter changchengzhani TaxID=2529274 RepID=A0A4R5MIU4_9SPHI|nr:HAMP domain-containing histidine kinase [Pedobacter changchengzhani]
MDHDMVEEIIEVKEAAAKNVFYKPHEFEDLIVNYKPIDNLNQPLTTLYGDTSFYNPLKYQLERGRYLKTQLILFGKPYMVTVVASKFEREEQIKQICLIIFLPMLLLFGILLLINRVMMGKLWRPFEKIVQNITKFNLRQDHAFEPVNTPIREFKTLNDAIVLLSNKVNIDYREIKLFTENASHEMMTPLAVINAKLDMILQSNVLDNDYGEILADLYKATSRLTKLNQSLLLLVKIDNNTINEQEQVDVKELVVEKINYFQELIHKRSLVLITNLSESTIFSNRQLMDVLINNLFSNVIRHNYEGGTIEILLNQSTIIFKNTGTKVALNAEKIFDRFYKDKASEGTGLGLSILKQICVKQDFNLNYQYENDLHIFTVSF